MNAPRLLLPFLCLLAALTGFAADYSELRREAERLFAEGSYAQARDAFQRIETNALPAADQRWVAFRLADSQWRAQGSLRNEASEAALQALDRLSPGDAPRSERDLVWAETHESLGDFHARRGDNPDWVRTRYGHALDWWAGQADLDTARRRYLDIVWKWQKPQANWPWWRVQWGVVPLDVLNNAVRIAKDPNDLARARYSRAVTLQQMGGGPDPTQQLVEEDFKAALAPGKTTDWHDDALFRYGQWLEQAGKLVVQPEGGWNREPDLPRALSVYRELVATYAQGESRWREPAERQIRNLTQPTVQVAEDQFYLPGSEIQFHLHTRNVKSVELTLTPVDLTRDARFTDPRKQLAHNWLDALQAGDTTPIRSWTEDTGDTGDYQQRFKTIRLPEKLAPGAYLVEAKAGEQRARELILVSDATLVLKASGQTTLAWFVDAVTGKPIAEAQVSLWLQYHDGSGDNPRWLHLEKSTDGNGLAQFDLAGRNGSLFVAAKLGERQAFCVHWANAWYSRPDGWQIYAYTDRPAYRPGDEAHWKLTVRQFAEGSYRTPAGRTLHYEITDPRGSKTTNGAVELNSFGSAWATLPLATNLPLGAFRITFWEDSAHQRSVGSATLFRLEEYKLPEFEVKVRMPETELPDGTKRPKTFRLGDAVEVVVQADYYFGGPVANATVELVIRQSPFYWNWPVSREFPWLHEDADANRWRLPRGYGGDQNVRRETLTTDATGRATLKLETDANWNDLELSVEARVTDSSRREVVGNGSVRVTRQRYSVNARPANNLPRPGEPVRVEFTAQDANHQPVAVTGTVRITRDFWEEVWLDSFGQEVKGDDLRRRRPPGTVWPPRPEPGMKDWVLKSARYEQEFIATNTVTLNAEGKGELTFTPAKDGYFRFAWTSPGNPALGGTESLVPFDPPVTAEATVWATSSRTLELGYHPGGLELIVDADTFRVGQKAPVMVVAPESGRHVLFTVEGGALDQVQVFQMAGTTKLIELTLEERHVPNIHLTAASVIDRELQEASREVVVPPTKNFLTIEVTPDRAQYQPRDEGTLIVTTKDHEGRPVPAEVALALVDESVFYIQSDYAGDPRQHFFSDKRGRQFQTGSSFNQRPFVRLVKGRAGDYVDDRFVQVDEAEFDRNTGDQDGRFDPVLARRYGLFTSDKSRSLSALGAVTGGRSLRNEMLEREAALLATGIAPRPAPAAMDSFAAGEPMQQSHAPGETEPVVVVRSDFRATAFWQPDVKTGADGTARIAVKYPESLTRWQATARAATTGNQFGWGKTNTNTKQPLIVRLQTPRFLTVGDLAVVSAVINNNTGEALTVTPKLDVSGAVITGGYVDGQFVKEERGPVTVPANGEARVNWAVSAQQAGDAKFTVSGRAGQLTDAMERSLPVHAHGISKLLARSGKATTGNVTVKLDLPPRKPGTTQFTVSVTPSLAVTMLDALPYLADYPYGCTEQTLSRFMPAVIVRQTLRDVGLDAETAMNRVFGGLSTNAAGQRSPALGAKKDLLKLDEMTAAGLKRLYDFQHDDGGWGWWKEGSSDPWMTAYIVWGLELARQAGLELEAGRLTRARDWLRSQLVQFEDEPANAAWALHALAAPLARVAEKLHSAEEARALRRAFEQRDQLTSYGRALLALAAYHYGYAEPAGVLVRNLANGVVRDDKPDASVLLGNAGAGAPATAHWDKADGWWRWHEGGVESTAFALRALLAIDPKNELVEPAANWLLKNRRGAQWSNTRDTAIVILALNDYLRATGELKSELDYEVVVNGQSLARRKVTPAEVLGAPSVFTVDEKLVRDANEVLIIRHAGDAPVYFAVNARFFTAEEPVTPAGSELFVRRQYFRLVPTPTLLKGVTERREPLNDGDTIHSGERVEVVLTVETKNDYEYLLFEDLKPAGLEATEIRSGGWLAMRGLKPSKAGAAASGDPGERSEFTGRSEGVYPEWRDRLAAMFVSRLPQGFWELRYSFRAETPGKFHALPTMAHAMYVPEIRANSAEVRLGVDERE